MAKPSVVPIKIFLSADSNIPPVLHTPVFAKSVPKTLIVPVFGLYLENPLV